MYSRFINDRATEDGFIDYLLFPWDWLTALTVSPEPEQLIWRHQARHESAVVESQAGDVTDDTKHRVVIEIESVRFPALDVRVQINTSQADHFLRSFPFLTRLCLGQRYPQLQNMFTGLAVLVDVEFEVPIF